MNVQELSILWEQTYQKQSIKIEHQSAKNGLSLAFKEREVYIYVPKEPEGILESNSYHVYFLKRGVCFFEHSLMEYSQMAPVIHDWIFRSFSCRRISSKYPYLYIDQYKLVLDKDTKKYIRMKWDQTKSIVKKTSYYLQYKQIVDQFCDSEISFLLPTLSPYEGISVSQFLVPKRHEFPWIRVHENNYIIKHYEQDEIVESHHSFSEIYDAYRAYLPQKMTWASYPI